MMWAWQDDRMCRLLEFGGWVVAVKFDAVNLDDLCRPLPERGALIVRCKEKPSDVISCFPMDSLALGCIAGWISDE